MWKYVNNQNNIKHKYVNVHHLGFDLSRPGLS